MLEKLLHALDKELFVILQCAAVEGLVPGASLFGMESNVSRKNDRDLSVPTTGINLQEPNECHAEEVQSDGTVQGPLGIVWMCVIPSLLQYESSFGPIRIRISKRSPVGTRWNMHRSEQCPRAHRGVFDNIGGRDPLLRH